MRVAIPVHNNRVSPVLDTARVLHVYDVSNRRLDQQTTGSYEPYFLETNSISQWIESIKAANVQTLICGAVSTEILLILKSLDIALIPWIVGCEREVLRAFHRNQLDRDQFCMPGCRRNRHRGVHGSCGYRGKQNKNGGVSS